MPLRTVAAFVVGVKAARAVLVGTWVAQLRQFDCAGKSRTWQHPCDACGDARKQDRRRETRDNNDNND
ncbi:hypothetical protein FHP25_11190 [Vineibacter terrae]|uniref:Uncharacterized protein n=1 Tax=Vineibacter terrae TaxID=2586908 RepID=A0A5C8PQQ5_9HYPH|nr:hypothetical protein [Vineibacter terrae]TXL76749.1 hypothetical protein FHP25_11190 [Vineibacter terrae]